jgi:NAD(P)-dependent dehydrogenase (short-subunit alcohol dehydrogenase family)
MTGGDSGIGRAAAAAFAPLCRKLVARSGHIQGWRIDILVINAARQPHREKIEELSTEDFDKTMKTNLYALDWIAQLHMPAGSAVITTASIQAYQPSPILLDYATTKAGIMACTKATKKLIERGIRAEVVEPGLAAMPETNGNWRHLSVSTLQQSRRFNA